VIDASANLTLYVDGAVAKTDGGNSPPGDGAQALRVGRWSGTQGSSEPFVGLIAQAAIWSASLTGDEVPALAGQWHPRLIKPASLVGCWDLGGFAGNNDRDHFGQYNLTAYNSPTWTDHPPVISPCRPTVVVEPLAAGVDTGPFEQQCFHPTFAGQFVR